MRNPGRGHALLVIVDLYYIYLAAKDVSAIVKGMERKNTELLAGMF